MSETEQTGPAGASRATDTAGVPDAALRSALELAVGIADEGRKLRPPLVFPAGLKPFLKMHRLDAAGLKAVRRAVVADEAYRDRLAMVDMTDLVDEIGTVWLRRPDGWEDEVRRLIAVARDEAAEASAAVALRRAEKRREAAEHAAARAQAELIGHHDALSREVRRRESADDQAKLATAQLDGLRGEVTGLRREVERLRAQLAASNERADAADAATREAVAQLRSVERVRDEMLSSRHVAPLPVAGPEPETARRNLDAAIALQNAAMATRDLATALAAAGQALAEDTPGAVLATPSPARERPASLLTDVKPLRTPGTRRKPIAIPGGIYGDSSAAAEHLLRHPDVCVLVDGYNVAKQAWPALALIEQRECCIEMLEDVARRMGTDIRVVFDGADVVGASSRRRLVRVQFSPTGVTADDVIRREVTSLPVRTPAVVVTNDQAIVSDVRSAGANVISSDALLAVAGRSAPR